jgi:serine/threonine protein kinase
MLPKAQRHGAPQCTIIGINRLGGSHLLYCDLIFCLYSRVHGLRRRSVVDSRVGLPENTVLDGSYRILRIVGAGGFGITYEAKDINLNTTVALKEYFPFDFGDRDATMSVRPKSDRHMDTFQWGRSNFLLEARTLAQFEHPSIVRVTRVFEANATAYMVMRFEHGQSFDTWLNKLGRPPSQQELDRIAGFLLDALELMHAANFLHRDIAPDNIIIRPDGSPVLLDFGSARRAVAEKSRLLTGIVKAGYSPHEQYASDARLQGPWSDLYALGGTFYRAVTGRPPEEATLRVIDDEMPPAALAGDGGYRAGFLRAIDACLRVKPAQRPQSVAQLRLMLLEHQAEAKARGFVPTLRVGDTLQFLQRRFSHRPQNTAARRSLGISVALLVTLALGAVVIKYAGPVERKEAEAQVQRLAVQAEDRLKAKRQEQARLDAQRAAEEQEAREAESKRAAEAAAAAKQKAADEAAKRQEAERLAAAQRAAEERARREAEAKRAADAAAAAAKQKAEEEAAKRQAERLAAAQREAEAKQAAEAAEAAAKRKEAERLAAVQPPPNETDRGASAADLDADKRTAFVKRIQIVLKQNACYQGNINGSSDDAQKGLDRYLDHARLKGKEPPARIELAKASASDFDAWLRDVADLKGRMCAVKPKATAQDRGDRAPRSRRSNGRAPVSYSGRGGGGGGGPIQGVR